MKTVLTKKQANDAMINSLFKKGGTLFSAKRKYCTGRYNDSIIGAELGGYADTVKLIWAEKKYSKEGNYYQLYCV